MEVRQLIRSGVAASALVHVSVVALLVLSSEVHPLGRVRTEPIAVEIVTPQEVPEQKPDTPEPPQVPQRDVSPPAKPANPAPAAPQAASAPPEPQAPPPKPQASPPERQAPPEPQSAPSPPPPAGQHAASATPQVREPQAQSAPPDPDRQLGIDLTLMYHEVFGWSEEAPSGPADSGDAKASTAADLNASVIAELRRHLKTCSKLPPSIAPTDKVFIKLRMVMTTDGRLAREPLVVEGTANLKGLDLKQSAVAALQSCQPFTMLPKDRYREWKVIDLTFTPEDFSS